jgi:CTP:molybdopterin cytidylyltransferase MocA
MKIATVLLAAGEGRRLGGPKALLPIGETTFLAHGCQAFQQAGLPVIAVLGAEAERVKREAPLPPGVSLVVNEAWRDGMLSSVWRGLDQAEAEDAEAVLLHPVDHPMIDRATVRRLAEALTAGAMIAVPTWQGRRGHPGGFARAVFTEIRSASLRQGARAVLSARPARVVEVPADPGCLQGIDTPEEYQQFLRHRAG